MTDFEKDKLRSLRLASAEDSHDDDDDVDDDMDHDDDDDDGEGGDIEIDAEVFVEQLLRFPCFKEAPRNKDPEELFEQVFSAYQEENLTEEQDHVVEFLIHVQEEDSPFNLTRAMEVWSKDDRTVFLKLLAEISALIDEDA